MNHYKLEDIADFCRQELATFNTRQLILLQGDLGAGKTTLIQKCVELCGVPGAESPTFSVINEYETVPKIYHVDLYRLSDDQDIESTGFWDLFLDDTAYIFVEWSNRISDKDWPHSWSPRQWKIQKSEKGNQYRSIESTALKP